MGYENILVFYIILDKIFETRMNIKIPNSFYINLIGYEESNDEDDEGRYIIQTELEIRKAENLYKFYENEIIDFREFLVRLQKCDESKHSSIMTIGKALITDIENLINKCELVTQNKHKTVNFEKLDIVEIKNSILRLAFRMSYTFDKLYEILSTDYIRKYYKGDTIYNWVLYILNTLCNNAFKDATIDKDGRINLETIKYICYSLFQTDEIVSRSNRNIVNRIFY